ncbi:hypothetical protein Chor_001649 [Crotalus horridus]
MTRGGEDEGRPPEQAASPPEASPGGGSGRPPPPPPPSARVPRLGLVLAFLAALLAAKYYRDAEAARRQETALKSLGNEGLFLFSSLDTNNDLYISPEEFKPIAEKLTGMVPVSGTEEEEVMDPSGETLSILAKFQPLLMETMTKSKDGFLGISHVAFTGLRNWTAPASPLSVMFARQFKAFLPPKNKLEPGDPWWIIPSELNIFTGYLPNNRFYPPAPKGKEVSVVLPNEEEKITFVIVEWGYLEFDTVVLIHKLLSYIVLSKDSSHVREFKLFVPNNRSLNVDMEWLYGALESSNMEMELESLGPSTPSVIHDENGNVIDSREGEPIQFIFEEISWQREISWEEASGKMEVVMYPFKKAFEKAKSEGSGRTLRETVLESSPILAFLNESFISTWSLVKELEDLQGKRDEITSKLADLHLEKYNFPVEIMICLPNGTVVHHINANYFLDITSMKPEEVGSSIFGFSSSFEDPSTATYLQFLKEGLQKAKPHLKWYLGDSAVQSTEIEYEAAMKYQPLGFLTPLVQFSVKT